MNSSKNISFPLEKNNEEKNAVLFTSKETSDLVLLTRRGFFLFFLIYFLSRLLTFSNLLERQSTEKLLIFYRLIQFCNH